MSTQFIVSLHPIEHHGELWQSNNLQLERKLSIAITIAWMYRDTPAIVEPEEREGWGGVVCYIVRGGNICKMRVLTCLLQRQYCKIFFCLGCTSYTRSSTHIVLYFTLGVFCNIDCQKGVSPPPGPILYWVNDLTSIFIKLTWTL